MLAREGELLRLKPADEAAFAGEGNRSLEGVAGFEIS